LFIKQSGAQDKAHQYSLSITAQTIFPLNKLYRIRTFFPIKYVGSHDRYCNSQMISHLSYREGQFPL